MRTKQASLLLNIHIFAIHAYIVDIQANVSRNHVFRIVTSKGTGTQ